MQKSSYIPYEIFIYEGLATGISIVEFKQQSVVISAIEAGNLIHVANSIREINPTSKIIIAGDNDIGNDKNTGKEKAIETAQAINGYYSIPDTDFKADWDDYRQQFGLEKTSASFNANLIKPELRNLSKFDTQNSDMLRNAKVKKELSGMNLSQMASTQRTNLIRNKLAIKRESDHFVDFCSYLDVLDYPNGMLIGN